MDHSKFTGAIKTSQSIFCCVCYFFSVPVFAVETGTIFSFKNFREIWGGMVILDMMPIYRTIFNYEAPDLKGFKQMWSCPNLIGTSVDFSYLPLSLTPGFMLYFYTTSPQVRSSSQQLDKHGVLWVVVPSSTSSPAMLVSPTLKLCCCIAQRKQDNK